MYPPDQDMQDTPPDVWPVFIAATLCLFHPRVSNHGSLTDGQPMLPVVAYNAAVTCPQVHGSLLCLEGS